MAKKISKETATRYDYVIRSIHDEEVDSVGYLYSEKEFDDGGRLLREVSYDSSGEVQEHLAYRYDESGRRLEARSYYDTGEDSVTETTLFTYGEDDHPLSAVKSYADGSEEQIHYTYNEARQILRKEVVNDEGEHEEEGEWRYVDGLEVWYERKEFGEAVFREEQEYDDQGRVTAITLWEAEADRTLVHRVFYNDDGLRNRIEKYDDQGRLLTVIEIPAFAGEEPLEMTENTSGRMRTNRYQYDEAGRLVLHQEFGQGGEMLTEVVKTYDDEGRLQSTEVTNDRQGMGMNQRYRIEYSYENAGM
jgi:hypothetical protein